MAMATRFELRQGQTQSLVMTPQLQQAIKLLQMNNLDLSAFVEAELERNPILDRAAAEAPADPRPAGEAPQDAAALLNAGSADEVEKITSAVAAGIVSPAKAEKLIASLRDGRCAPN